MERFFAYAQNDRLSQEVRAQNDSLVVRQISERELGREIDLRMATGSRGEPRKRAKKEKQQEERKRKSPKEEQTKGNKQRGTNKEEPRKRKPPASI